MILSQQRCLNHVEREAVCKCPECKMFFCRECITEHDDRIICSSCLRKQASKQERQPQRIQDVFLLLGACISFMFLWLVFYSIGHLLISIPSYLHDAGKTLPFYQSETR